MFVNATLDEVAADGRPLPPDAASAARRRGPGLLPRGRPAHRLPGDQGRARARRRVRCARSAPSTPTTTCSTPTSPAPPGGTGESFDWALATLHGRDAAAVLSGGLDPGQRGRGDRGGAPVRGRQRQRHRGGARPQGPGQAEAFFRAVEAADAPRGRRRHEHAARSSGASAPTGAATCPETLIPALDELEREWLAARADPAFQEELGAAAARLRRPPDAALPGAAALRRPPAARSSSSARTCSTRARTRSTTRSARRCSPSGWASRA